MNQAIALKAAEKVSNIHGPQPIKSFSLIPFMSYVSSRAAAQPLQLVNIAWDYLVFEIIGLTLIKPCFPI